MLFIIYRNVMQFIIFFVTMTSYKVCLHFFFYSFLYKMMSKNLQKVSQLVFLNVILKKENKMVQNCFNNCTVQDVFLGYLKESSKYDILIPEFFYIPFLLLSGPSFFHFAFPAQFRFHS